MSWIVWAMFFVIAYAFAGVDGIKAVIAMWAILIALGCMAVWKQEVRR